MINNKSLIIFFIKLLSNFKFNNNFYKSWYDNEDLVNFPYTTIWAVNWFLKRYCLDKNYNVIDNYDFVDQVIKWFEELYWKDKYIDEVIMVWFIEVFLEFEENKTKNFLKLFSNIELIEEIFEYYEWLFWKKLK